MMNILRQTRMFYRIQDINVLERRGKMRERRVGTFTLGVVLLVFGVLFLLHMFFKGMEYYFIFELWPVILILLGGEVLYYALHQKQLQYKYDFAAIIIVMMLVVFALCMAGFDWMYQHFPDRYWFRI